MLTIVIFFSVTMKDIKYIKTVSLAEKAVTDILTKEKPVVGVKCLGVNVGERGKSSSFFVINTMRIFV